MSSGNRGNWNNKRPWGGGGRGGFGGRGRGSGRGVNKNYRGHNFGNNRGFRGGRQNDYGGRGPPQPYQNYSQTRDSPGKRLSEEEIGVTEYINNHEGFLGVIKSRYSDFQVSEINLNGEIAKLTSTKPPEPPVDKDVEEDEDLLLNKYNVEILPMDVWDRINKLAVSEASSETVEVDVTGMSKEHRTKIHDAVKKAFGDSIVGSTVGDEDKKLVRFERYRKGGLLPSDVNAYPFTRDLGRDERIGLGVEPGHNTYYDSAAMALPYNTDCIGAGPSVPYNATCSENAFDSSNLGSSVLTIPSHFTQCDSSTTLHNIERVGTVSTVPPLFTGRTVSTVTSCNQGDRAAELVAQGLALVQNLPDGTDRPVALTPNLVLAEGRTQLDGRDTGSVLSNPCLVLADDLTQSSEVIVNPVTSALSSAGSALSGQDTFWMDLDIEATHISSSNKSEQALECQFPIPAQLDANWTLQNPKKLSLNKVTGPKPMERKINKKKNPKQRQRDREMRAALAKMGAVLNTNISGQNEQKCVSHPPPFIDSSATNQMMKEASLLVADKKGNSTSSRKGTTEVIASNDHERQIIDAKESSPEIVSHKIAPHAYMMSNEAKFQKKEAALTYAKAKKAGLVAYIKPVTGHLSPQLSEEFQQQLQMRLMEEAMQPNNESGPMFRGKPVYSNGILRLWCEDQNTLTWLKKSSSTITLSTGDKIIVNSLNKFPRMVRCGIRIPGIWDDFSVIAKALTYQNPWAEVDRWILHNMERREINMFAFVNVPEILVKTILDHERRLGFMLGSVYLKFLGPNGKFVEYPPSNVLKNLHRNIDTASTGDTVEEDFGVQTEDLPESLSEKQLEDQHCQGTRQIIFSTDAIKTEFEDQFESDFLESGELDNVGTGEGVPGEGTSSQL